MNVIVELVKRLLSRPKKGWPVAFLIGFVVASLLWLVILGDRYDPPETKVVFVDKVRPPKKRLRTPYVPNVLYIYRKTTDTVVVRVPLPRKEFTMRGVVGQEPLTIRRRKVYFTYWNPYELRFEQAEYRLRPPRWAVWLDAGIEYVFEPTLISTLTYRRNRFTAYVGYAGQVDHHGVVFGLRYRLLHYGH